MLHYISKIDLHKEQFLICSNLELNTWFIYLDTYVTMT